MGAGNSAPQEQKYFINGSIPFFRTADVGRVHFSTDLNETGDYLNKEAVNELGLKIWPKHTILFPKSGASTFLNHRVMTGTDGVVSSHLATIFTENDILQKYIFYFLTTIDAKMLTADQGYPSLRISDLQRVKIPLPPLEAQKQIVERLDKIAEAQKLNNDLIQKSNELFQSLLHKELNPAGKNWEMKKLGEIIDPQYGYTAAAQDAGEYRFIRITDIDDFGELRSNDKKYVAIGPEEAKPYKLNAGDLLLARTGATFGKILYFKESEPAIFASFLIRLNPNTSIIDPFYIWLFSRSHGYWRQAKSLMTGSGQPQFNANKLKQIKVPLPPLEIQKQIVAKLSAVQEYKKKLVEQRAKLKELFESSLHKSMSNK